MSLGLFVEGRSDKDTIPILIRKLGYRASVRTQVIPRGDMLKFDKIRSFIINLMRTRGDISLVIICIDAEESDPDNLLKMAAMPIQLRLNRDREIPIPVRYSIVDHAIEGWIACDQDAVQEVLGHRARVSIRENPEHSPNPASILERIFRQNGRNFQKTRHNREIAEAATPENIAAKSPTFQRFAELLGHPI